ncbi:hypothetical protein TNCV_2114991 [Trichonephila clavipes]|nr:hypothetical protein TNCV_2114991 [Trichonephila clavipes]
MTSHNRLNDFLRRRTIRRLEAGQSHAEVARWLQVTQNLYRGYGINFIQVVLFPGSSSKVTTHNRHLYGAAPWN